jgi:hypothetical protein
MIMVVGIKLGNKKIKKRKKNKKNFKKIQSPSRFRCKNSRIQTKKKSGGNIVLRNSQKLGPVITPPIKKVCPKGKDIITVIPR